MATDRPDRHVGVLLRRRDSFSRYEQTAFGKRHDARWPRHLSFTVAEDSVLPWTSISGPLEDDLYAVDPGWQEANELAVSEDAKSVAQRLADLEAVVGDWVSRQMHGIEALEGRAEADQQELDGMFYPRADEYRALEQRARDELARERARLSEALKEVEVLGAKLEYEINSLRGKVEDVEDGVSEFERQVASVEDRVAELEYDMRPREGWLQWLVRLTTGIGKAPIVAGRKTR